MTTPPEVFRFLDRKEAAGYLTSCGIRTSRHSLAKWACVGGGPKFRKFGKWPKYTKSDLDIWINSKLSSPIVSTSELSQAAGETQQ